MNNNKICSNYAMVYAKMINCLRKYDVSLKKHLEKVSEKSSLNGIMNKQNKGKSSSNETEHVGQGSFVSFIGKNTV